MATLVTFYGEPTNLDYLMPRLRLSFGDLTGAVYSDTIMRTALVNSIEYLQKQWASKYQVYHNDLQTGVTGSGFVEINSSDGIGNIPSGLEDGSIFRNPYVIFTQNSPPIIESIDSEAIVLAATYLLRKTQVSSSAADFTSWRTEDISYSNLGSERSLSKLLSDDKAALDEYFRKNIARPQRSDFAIAYLPAYNTINSDINYTPIY